VIDDVGMLELDGLVEVLRQAATDPLQWLWLERHFHRHGMTPAVVWQVLYPGTACPYAPPPSSDRTTQRQSKEEPSLEEREVVLLAERIVRDPSWIQECEPARRKLWALAETAPAARAALTKALVQAQLNPSLFWDKLATECGG
jgi:hypothetical protein